MRALHAAASGMAAQQTRLDNVANNLANVNTTGFKKAREKFQDLFYQELTHGGQAASTASVQVGTGVRLASVEKEHSQGQLTATERPLDLAIQGDAWFVLETREGEQVYTRDGNFTRDADGRLVSSGGLEVAGHIVIPMEAEQVIVEEDGSVSALLDGDMDYTFLGQIELARFANDSGLTPMGGNLFRESPNSGEAMPVTLVEESRVMQGFLEGSNVDVAEELISMIQTQRSYELNSKVVQAADEAMGLAANLRR